jgi:hypothetical protein
VERPHPCADVGRGSDLGLAGREVQRLAGDGFQDGPRELRRGVEREAAVVQSPAEGALEPCHQLDAFEASEADLPLQGGVGGRRTLARAPASRARVRTTSSTRSTTAAGAFPGGGASVAAMGVTLRAVRGARKRAAASA